MLVKGLLLFALVFSFSLRAHPLVSNYLTISLNDEFNNGYPEKRYHEVLDLFLETFSPFIKERGGELVIKRDFRDGAVNAWAWRERDKYILEIPGGLSRYYLISEEGFVTTICHELGHLLAGAPTKGYLKRISTEGQSDYYIGRCVRHFFRVLKPYKEVSGNSEARELCKEREEKGLCLRAMMGSLSLASYYAKLERKPFPSLLNESKVVVRETLATHPPSQCRLDTMKRSFFCPVSMDERTSNEDQLLANCHKDFYPEYQRPKCWYKSI